MPNTNAPFGFRFFLHGGTREPFRVRRDVPAGRSAPLMIGDAYTLDAQGRAVRAAPTDTVAGIVEAIELRPVAGSPEGPVSQDYIPASDAGAIIGIEDKTAIFVAQATTVAQSDVGQLARLTNTVPADIALRQSRQQIDGATYGGTGQFRVIAISPEIGNEPGPYGRVLVRIA